MYNSKTLTNYTLRKKNLKILPSTPVFFEEGENKGCYMIVKLPTLNNIHATPAATQQHNEIGCETCRDMTLNG